MHEVLDHGYVKLITHSGGDLSVVDSARISYNAHAQRDGLSDADIGLINYLMKHRHGTPFEHNMFTFLVKAPIFVFREWHRHRIASINEMSGRYTELGEDFYIPYHPDVRVRVGKPGAYTYAPASIQVAITYRDRLRWCCEEGYARYKEALHDDIAPELARLFLHVNHYSEMYWTVNSRSLMNFLSLRNHPTAQWEIAQYAQALEDIFKEQMFHTYNAFVDNGRVAP
jgi:thymidylate synthase (FAD)